MFGGNPDGKAVSTFSAKKTVCANGFNEPDKLLEWWVALNAFA